MKIIYASLIRKIHTNKHNLYLYKFVFFSVLQLFIEFFAFEMSEKKKLRVIISLFKKRLKHSNVLCSLNSFLSQYLLKKI